MKERCFEGVPEGEKDMRQMELLHELRQMDYTEARRQAAQMRLARTALSQHDGAMTPHIARREKWGAMLIQLGCHLMKTGQGTPCGCVPVAG